MDAHILLVDDDGDIRSAMRLALEIEGYRVELAGDGREAWDRLHRHARPALILLDIMMPVMDGSEFLRLLRSDPQLRTIPVVLVTAFGATSRAAELAHQTEGCLAKPIDLDELLRVVARHVPRSPEER